MKLVEEKVGLKVASRGQLLAAMKDSKSVEELVKSKAAEMALLWVISMVASLVV